MIRKIQILILFSVIAFAGTTGKIVGKVVDASTGDSMSGCNVMLENTYLGAATNEEGKFTIVNISPGVYTVRAMMMGYAAVKMQNVKVLVDLTTEINFELSEETLSGETITVVAERAMVQRDLTASAVHVQSDEIKAMPIETVDEIIGLQAGVVAGHIRGGRHGETKYMVDGIPITDVYSGDMAVDVEAESVQELQLITGAFNAEYGQAMSGVVNIVTKNGNNDFKFHIGNYIGDWQTTHSHYFPEVSSVNLGNIQNLSLSISGPVIKDNLFFYLTSRYYKQDGYFYGERIFMPSDNSNFVDTDSTIITNNPTLLDSMTSAEKEEISVIVATGDSSVVPMNPFRKWTAHCKLSWRITDKVNLSYNFMGDNFINDLIDRFAPEREDLKMRWRDYDHGSRLNPDGRGWRYRNGYTNTLKLSHQLNDRSFYTFGLTRFKFDYKQYLFPDAADDRYGWSVNGSDTPIHTFSTGGLENFHFNRSTVTTLLKGDYTSQITDVHQIKTGIEYSSHNIFRKDSYFDGTTGNEKKNTLERLPKQFAAYFQDKAEFKSIVINGGIRLDYFDSASPVLADERDPDILDPIRYISLENGYYESMETGDTLSYDELFSIWYLDAIPKIQISPRFGMGYPITDKGVIHISYGHFFQMPAFDLLYTNPEFTMNTGTGLNTIMGNPNINAQSTVSYELGLQQQISDNIAVDATIFFRDIRDLVSTDKIVRTYGQQLYSQYVNRDYANARGLVFSLDKRAAKLWQMNLHYTLQIAEGNASDPRSIFYSLQANKEPNKQIVPLNWDRRHTFNINLAISDWEKWGISLIGQFGSGLPYTPEKQGILTMVENGGRKPVWYNVNGKCWWNFMLVGSQTTMYLKIDNLFDLMIENDIFADTGTAYYTTSMEQAEEFQSDASQHINTIEEVFISPTRFSSPMRITFGFEWGM